MKKVNMDIPYQEKTKFKIQARNDQGSILDSAEHKDYADALVSAGQMMRKFPSRTMLRMFVRITNIETNEYQEFSNIPGYWFFYCSH